MLSPEQRARSEYCVTPHRAAGRPDPRGRLRRCAASPFGRLARGPRSRSVCHPRRRRHRGGPAERHHGDPDHADRPADPRRVPTVVATSASVSTPGRDRVHDANEPERRSRPRSRSSRRRRSNLVWNATAATADDLAPRTMWAPGVFHTVSVQAGRPGAERPAAGAAGPGRVPDPAARTAAIAETRNRSASAPRSGPRSR